jgi:hypothetical protein
MEFELGLAFYNAEILTDGCFISFNGVDDARIIASETEQGVLFDVSTSSGARFLRLADLLDAYNGTLNEENAQIIISDHFDEYLSKATASSRSICAHYEADDARYSKELWVWPHLPYGVIDAKVMSTKLAEENIILARWGSACGRTFDSSAFIKDNIQYYALAPYLYDRPSQFWSEFSSVE